METQTLKSCGHCFRLYNEGKMRGCCDKGRLDDLEAENKRLMEALEDVLEDIELSQNPDFIAAMSKIVTALEKGDFDFSKVKEVNSVFDNPALQKDKDVD